MYPGQVFCARGILQCEGRQRHTNLVCAVRAAVSRRRVKASRGVHTATQEEEDGSGLSEDPMGGESWRRR